MTWKQNGAICRSVFLYYLCTGFQKHMQKLPENIIQLVTASVLSIGGMVMLFCGIYIDPLGELHESLLIGFGEVATFAGALFGIDYTYKFKNRNTNASNTKPPND